MSEFNAKRYNLARAGAALAGIMLTPLALTGCTDTSPEQDNTQSLHPSDEPSVAPRTLGKAEIKRLDTANKQLNTVHDRLCKIVFDDYLEGSVKPRGNYDSHNEKAYRFFDQVNPTTRIIATLETNYSDDNDAKILLSSCHEEVTVQTFRSSDEASRYSKGDDSIIPGTVVLDNGKYVSRGGVAYASVTENVGLDLKTDKSKDGATYVSFEKYVERVDGEDKYIASQAEFTPDSAADVTAITAFVSRRAN